MIIYIHGFGSSGHGGKATLFKEFFKNDIITPSLSYVPTLAIDTLEQLIKAFQLKGETINLIGSSLGGYYSIYLANKYNLKAVLINPAIFPYKILGKIGMAKNYFDETSFEITSTHMQQLKQIEVKSIENENNFLTLLQTGDEILDYKQAIKKLPNSYLEVYEGGNHSFCNIENYFFKIDSFFNK
ncbi:esterase [Malaciobacter halophilus]|uniref:YqiA/YcfP family alpha/beta fold hydrolase n=1 Tax=Malaciobacter marinus TaxID=505249 RepID=UPI000C08C924|nr:MULTISPECIES: YqiA/YcfP family alpha/beta fold hydrolase [Malaciobacter]PHO12246.1 esterase [Malaciobacter marinus]RYA24528.1 esterase [Malaciobacter halophilus]